jgi:uncharacterized membrane protein
VATVERTAEFNTPVDRAFNLIADVSRWPEWIPPLTSVSNVSGTGMGTTYDWEFKLGPLPPLRGKGEIVKLIPNRRFEIQTEGVPSTWSFAFSDRGDQSVIKVAIEYDIPGGSVASGLVNKQIEESVGLLSGLLES